MATIAGTIVLPNGEAYVGQVKFFRLDAPAAVGSLLVTGVYNGLAVQTEPTGEFATELKAGTYKVQIAGASAWRIHIFDDTATYNLTEIGAPGIPFYPGSGGSVITVQGADFALQGVTELRAVANHINKQLRYLAYLTFVGDGQGGEFEYSAASMAEDDGVLVIRPDNVDEADPGRWHATNNPT